VLCLVGCSASGLPATTDPDRLAVREFLRNDLSEPQWEEVEWWGGREGISVFTRVCRMKYRCLTPRGRIMMDDVFVLDHYQGENLPDKRKVERLGHQHLWMFQLNNFWDKPPKS